MRWRYEAQGEDVPTGPNTTARGVNRIWIKGLWLSVQPEDWNIDEAIEEAKEAAKLAAPPFCRCRSRQGR